jgi:hypothetical protein
MEFMLKVRAKSAFEGENVSQEEEMHQEKEKMHQETLVYKIKVPPWYAGQREAWRNLLPRR